MYVRIQSKISLSWKDNTHQAKLGFSQGLVQS